jgi:hypothetical protein
VRPRLPLCWCWASWFALLRSSYRVLTVAKRSRGICCISPPSPNRNGNATLPFGIPRACDFFDRVAMRTKAEGYHTRYNRSGNRSQWKRQPTLCHPERSRGICSSTYGRRQRTSQNKFVIKRSPIPYGLLSAIFAERPVTASSRAASLGNRLRPAVWSCRRIVLHLEAQLDGFVRACRDRTCCRYRRGSGARHRGERCGCRSS